MRLRNKNPIAFLCEKLGCDAKSLCLIHWPVRINRNIKESNEKYSAAARQFISFKTKNEKTFHLIINHDEKDEENEETEEYSENMEEIAIDGYDEE